MTTYTATVSFSDSPLVFYLIVFVLVHVMVSLVSFSVTAHVVASRSGKKDLTFFPALVLGWVVDESRLIWRDRLLLLIPIVWYYPMYKMNKWISVKLVASDKYALGMTLLGPIYCVKAIWNK